MARLRYTSVLKWSWQWDAGDGAVKFHEGSHLARCRSGHIVILEESLKSEAVNSQIGLPGSLAVHFRGMAVIGQVGLTAISGSVIRSGFAVTPAMASLLLSTTCTLACMLPRFCRPFERIGDSELYRNDLGWRPLLGQVPIGRQVNCKSVLSLQLPKIGVCAMTQTIDVCFPDNLWCPFCTGCNHAGRISLPLRRRSKLVHPAPDTPRTARRRS